MTMNRKVISIGLSETVYKVLDKMSFAKKKVGKGEWTDTHDHRFFSLYLTKNMEKLVVDDVELPLPTYALSIVLPRVNHTWSNQRGTTDDCFVSDLSPGHGEHITYR